jgi:hypothetical protein
MSSWRDLAADVFASREEVPAPAGVPRPEDLIKPENRSKPDIAGALLERVASLSRMPPPKVKNCAAWFEVVQDAQRLVSEGWAERALALGWTAGDLFGVGQQDSHDFAGLAVWLAGRRIVVIDETIAVARGDDGRAVFNRRSFGHGKDARQSPVLLWQFGRG